VANQSNGSRVPVSRDAIQVVVGVAALGWAGREMIKNRRRPTVLGVRLPRELAGVDLKGLDTHKIAKQVGKAAEQLERTSDDVRMISAQARRLSKRLA
jgi:hypothetical protein